MLYISLADYSVAGWRSILLINFESWLFIGGIDQLLILLEYTVK